MTCVYLHKEVEYELAPLCLRDGRASKTGGRVKITPREKGETRRLAFLTWGDFHAHSRFARSTVPEEKWGLRNLIIANKLRGAKTRNDKRNVRKDTAYQKWRRKFKIDKLSIVARKLRRLLTFMTIKSEELVHRSVPDTLHALGFRFGSSLYSDRLSRLVLACEYSPLSSHPTIRGISQRNFPSWAVFHCLPNTMVTPCWQERISLVVGYSCCGCLFVCLFYLHGLHTQQSAGEEGSGTTAKYWPWF